MRTIFMTLTASSFALTASPSLVLPQALPDVHSPTYAAPSTAFDAQQFPEVRGEFERLTLSARGDIDGFILRDGTEIKTAPALSSQIASVITPGDRVTIHGLKAAALPLVSAVSITNDATQHTITDSGASVPLNPLLPSTPPLRGGPPQTPYTASETSGKVRMALHGPQGEVNGILLESGIILRFPPDQRGQLVAIIQPHHDVVARGTASTNALGTVVDVQQLGASRDQLMAVGPPARPIQGAPQTQPPRLPSAS